MTAFTVEIWYDGGWHDITADTRQAGADSGGGWTAVRGQPSRLAVPDPAELTLVLNNGASLVEPGVSGRYSLRNPLSDLYGKIRRGTPIRVRVPGVTAADRWHGRVSRWPVRWSPSRKDLWVPITAHGPIWWQQQGTRPDRSALYRWYTRVAEVSGYWPLEDEAGSTEARTPTEGAQPARPTTVSRFTGPDGAPIPPAGLPEWGSGAPIPGSLPTVDLSRGGGVGAPVPAGTGSDGWEIEWVMVCPRDGEDTSGRIPIWWETTDAFTDHPTAVPMRYEFQIESTGFFSTYGFNFTSWGSASGTFSIYDGQPHHYRVRGDQDGGNIRVRVWVDGALVDTFASFSDTMAGTVGQVATWLINTRDYEAGDGALPTMGHIAVSNGAFAASSSGYEAMTGWDAEPAGSRFVAVGSEDDLSAVVSSSPAETEVMGPQPAGTTLSILRDCVATDGGLLVERRDAYGLRMIRRADLYNQTALSLPFSVLSPPMEPADDLREVRNQVVAKRSAGGELTVSLTEGPLNTADPDDDPDGIGVVPTELAVNVHQVGQLANAAWWELAAGTQDVPRFAAVTVVLDAPDVADLVDDIAALDVGSVIAVTGLDEVGLPPDPLRLMILAVTEVCDWAQPWTMTWTVTPADVWTVGVVGTTTRVNTRGSQTTHDFPAGVGTALGVQRSAGTRTLWTTDAGAFPFDLMVAGVRLTATGCSGAGDPQTFTVDQVPVNGVRKIIPAGSQVRLAEPWRIAR